LEKSSDVTIIGAGPAGATLAYELAKRGITVILLERERLPRYKCCAGGVTRKAAKLLDFDIAEAVEDVVCQVDITYELGETYVGQHSQPLMYTVMRDVFDHLLIKKAHQQGALILDGQKGAHVHVGHDSVEVSTVDGRFGSQLVVGADGVYSVLARELGLARSIEFATAIGSEVSVPDEELARWKSRAQMELGYLPGGYAWVFPKRNHLSVGLGCPSSGSTKLTRPLLHDLLDSVTGNGYSILAYRSHLIPTCTEGRFVWRDKALLVGDAAGLADPLSGEGIHNAILSAQLAAPAIEDCLTHGGSHLDDYQQALEERIMPELKIARVASKIRARFPHLAFRLLQHSEGAWRAGCGLMSGELTYADIRRSAGGFRGMVDRLLRLQGQTYRAENKE
jgi:geranylgeranyl reductase family protein